MSECVFCRKIEEGSVQREGLRVFSFEPLNPVTNGHRLFVTQTHLERPDEDPVLASLAFASAARHASEQASAYNLIVNAGSAASQTIPHVHVHYVPRRAGDGLSLPWTGLAATLVAFVKSAGLASAFGRLDGQEVDELNAILAAYESTVSVHPFQADLEGYCVECGEDRHHDNHRRNFTLVTHTSVSEDDRG